MRLVRANLVAPHRHARRRAADADRPDHLLVDDDGKAAGVGEEAELNLLQLRRRILDDAVHPVLAGLASLSAVRAFISAVTMFR